MSNGVKYQTNENDRIDNIIPSNGVIEIGSDKTLIFVEAGSSIQDVIDGIGDAAIDKPYLIQIGPGVFEENLVGKPYVSIAGSGIDTTLIAPATGAALSDGGSISVGVQFTGMSLFGGGGSPSIQITNSSSNYFGLD